METALERRRERLAGGAKWALGLAGAAIIAPVAFLAIKGIAGVIVALAMGQAAIQLAPVAGMKLANWRMKLLVKEAEANPIETMQNLFVEKSAELVAADNNVAEFQTEVLNFDDQVGTFKEQYPEEADSYEALAQRMHGALEDMKREQVAAREKLQGFERKIGKARAIYKMAMAAQKVVKLSRSAEAQVFAQIKEQVAFDAVRTELNRSFANLSLALERRTDARAALPGARGQDAPQPSKAVGVIR